MNKKLLIFLIAFLCYPIVSAQRDPVAISILDNFSQMALSAPSVSIKFSLIVDDAVEETHIESEGEIVIKDNRYKLTIPENIVWFDGEAIYTLVPDVDEVTITEPNPDDEAFFSSPSLLFTMYSEGYKVRLIGESEKGSVIDLYPEKLGADFTRIRLSIDKSYKLISAEYKRKDGISMILNVTDYNLQKSYRNSFFSFDSKKYSNVDIIDMRF